MALDPSIILQAGKGVTPLMSPAEIQDQQMQREVGGMKLAQLRQGMQDDQTMRSIAQNTAPEGLAGAYYKAGLIKPAQDALKFQSDQKKAQADQSEAGGKLVKALGGPLKFLADNPTLQDAAAVLMHLNTAGLMTPEQVQSAKKQIDADPTPEGIKRFAMMGYQAAIDAEKQMPKIQTNNVGGQTVTQAINPMNAQPVGSSAITNTQSPDSIASNATSSSNNARTVSASRENAAATRAVADATRAAAGTQRDQATEMKLSDDYRAQSKDFKAVGDAYLQINSTLDKATQSPAATLAAATKFMKLLDPGSVVRESELGMALQASGVFDRATNYYNTLAKGKVLTATQVADFKNITQQIYGAAQEGQKLLDADYTQRAKTYGLRPENIVQQLGQNKGVGAPKQAVKRTGTMNGRKVVEYADGSVDYAD